MLLLHLFYQVLDFMAAIYMVELWLKIENGLLSTILIIVFIPLYLCILRPFISYHIPGMLKRIGLGFFLLCISLVSLLVKYTVTHGNISVYAKLNVCVNTEIVNTTNILNPSSLKVII